MSLKSVAKSVGQFAFTTATGMTKKDLERVHANSVLGRIMRKEKDPDQDGIVKSVVKGMMGGAYETATDNSLLGRLRNRRAEEDDLDYDTDDSNSRPVLASVVDTAKRVSSPTMTVISRQLQDVVNRVMMMGKHLKKQQDMMVDQVRQQEHINKENIMEANRRLLPNNDNDNAGLAAAFNSLSDRIANAVADMESNRGGLLSMLSDMLGFGGGGSGFKGLFSKGNKAVKLKKGIKAVETATGTRYRNVATGRFVKAADAIKKPGVIGRLTTKVGQTLSKASKLSAVAKVGEIAGKVTPQLIKKLAMPLAAKAVGKTVLKSIPIVGAIAGVGFAAKRLLEGDITGAGLDLVSGLGGPLTAIPALILSLARDLYAQAFGIQPEQDPLVGKRMGMVKEGVKMAVEQTISPAIKPQQSAAGDNQKALSIPKPLKPAANDNAQAKPAAVPSFNPGKPQIPAKPKPSAPVTPSAPPKAPSAKPASKPSVTAIPSAPKPIASSGAAVAGAALSAGAPTPTTSSESSSATAGKAIAEASMHNDTLTMPTPAPDPSANIPSVLPAKTPTTLAASQGIGNVPDPTYFDIDTFMGQMYFGAAA